MAPLTLLRDRALSRLTVRHMQALRALVALGPFVLAVATTTSGNAQDRTDPVATDPVANDSGTTTPPTPTIAVNRLADVDFDALGSLDDGDGGLGDNLWRGSERETVMSLMARLPVTARSPAMRDLTRRLVLTAAPPPVGRGESGAFLAARLTALVDIAEFESAQSLLAQVPQRGRGQALSQSATDLLFLANNAADACAIVREQVRATATPYWQRGLIFCQATAGETTAARLSLDLLRETDSTGDGFDALARILIDDRKGDVANVVPSPLTLAMVRAAEVELPDTFIASGAPGLLRSVADSGTLSSELRLAAGEQAAAMGALAPVALSALYDEIVVSPSDLANPIEAAAETTGPWSRAVLHQAIRQAPSDEARVRYMGEAWRRGASATSFGVAVRASALSLQAVKPAMAAPEDAADAAVAAAQLGLFETAEAWLEVLGTTARGDSDAGALYDLVRPVVFIANAGKQSSWKPALARRWANGLPIGISGEARAARIARMFIVLDALGYEVGKSGWAMMLNGPLTVTTEIPVVGLRYGLRDAVRAGETGLAILYGLIALGPGGPATASPLALGSVLRSLRALGLDDDARALAVEAVVESRY